MYVVLKVHDTLIKYSSLAQSVEHSAVNRVVVGSSPTGGAWKARKFNVYGLYLLLGQGPVFWPGVFRVPKNGGLENQKTTCYASG